MSPDKFEKVVLLLSSDQPGEVFAAAQAIGRALPASGLDWYKFAKLVTGRLSSKPEPQTPPPHKEQYAHDYATRGTVSRAEQDIIKQLYEQMGDLTDGERDFISGLFEKVCDYGSAAFISEKQRKWLNRIWDRHIGCHEV